MQMPIHCSAKASAAVGAWVLLEPNEEEPSEWGGQNNQLGGSAEEGKLAVRSSGRAFMHNASNRYILLQGYVR